MSKQELFIEESESEGDGLLDYDFDDHDPIYVSLDFGTCFSGVAFVAGEAPHPDKIEVIRKWADSDQSTSDKVPSELVYTGRGKVCKWGYSVAPTDSTVRCIKLLLDPGQTLPDFANKDDLLRQLKTAGKTPVHAAADLLSKIITTAKEQLQLRYTAATYRVSPKCWILTVPALWSDAAKNATVEAAHLAGLTENVRLVPEPDAAIVHALTSMPEIRYKKHDVFIVCDAGGGTVDLITYEIVNTEPLTFHEVVPGEGGLCGGNFLNMKFEQYVKSVLTPEQWKQITVDNPRTWAHAARHFETYTKRSFDPGKARCDTSRLDIPFGQLKANEKAGIKDGWLHLPAEKIEEFFESLIVQILSLIESQRKQAIQAGRSPRSVIAVGGFGRNDYLLQRIKKKFGDVDGQDTAPALEVILACHSWSSVARGAVLCGLAGSALVAVRKARRSYGVMYDRYLAPGEAHPLNSYYDELEETHRVPGSMKWFIHKGDEIRTDEPTLVTFHRTASEVPDELDEVLYCCDDDVPPAKKTARVRPLCNFTIHKEERVINARSWAMMENDNGDPYRDLTFQLGIHISSGNLEFDLRVRNKVIGKVEAKFE